MPFMRVLSFAIGVVVLGSLSAQADERFMPKDGRFSIRFPARPKETSQKTQSALGELAVFTATYATTEGNVYLVSYTDFPAGSIKPETQSALYDGVRDGLKKDGKLVADKELTLGADKLPMREIVVEKAKQTLRFRVVIRENRLYQVAVVGSDEFTKSKDATAFLDSFEVIK